MLVLKSSLIDIKWCKRVCLPLLPPMHLKWLFSQSKREMFRWWLLICSLAVPFSKWSTTFFFFFRFLPLHFFPLLSFCRISMSKWNMDFSSWSYTNCNVCTCSYSLFYLQLPDEFCAERSELCNMQPFSTISYFMQKNKRKLNAYLKNEIKHTGKILILIAS